MNVLTSSLSVGSGNAETGNGPRTNGNAGSKSKSGFDALLQDPPVTQKSDKPSPPAGQDTKPSQPSSASDETRSSESEDTVPAAPANGQDDNADTAQQADEAPWPPLGLSAMLLPAPEAAPAPIVPPAAAAQGDTRPGSNPALPCIATTLPATAAITAAQAPAAESAEPLPAALTAAIAQGADDAASSKLDIAESPAPTTFNALLQNPALHELRATAAGGSVPPPTATPDINSGDFDETFGARVGWMADQKIGHAHIRITPHDLGLVEVKLQLDGDRVHASFSSAHADVRHALESSLPRLREMLGEQGLQLAQADVGQQPTSQQQGGDGQAASGGGFADGQDPAVDMPAPSTQALRMRGLLDAYA